MPSGTGSREPGTVRPDSWRSDAPLQWPAMGVRGSATDGDTDEDRRAVRAAEAEALANVLAVLQLCGAGKLRCSDKTQRPAAATVSAVAEVLAGGDFYPTEPIAAFAWPLLIQAGGLAELAGSRMQLTAKGRTALGRPPAETVRLLWRSWVSKAVIDELSRVEHIKGQRTTNTLTSARTRRQAVASALTDCPADEWVPVDDLFTRMRRVGQSPTVARSERALLRRPDRAVGGRCVGRPVLHGR